MKHSEMKSSNCICTSNCYIVPSISLPGNSQFGSVGIQGGAIGGAIYISKSDDGKRVVNI